MNFEEFERNFSEYLNSNRGCDNHKCIAYIRDDETGYALVAAHCTKEEAMQMIFVIARKCGITLKQLAYMYAINSDKDASMALDGLIKESNKQERLKKAIASVEKAKAATASAGKADIASDNAKSGDKSQKSESQKSQKNDEGDFDKDEIADVISAVLMDVLKSLDD